MNRLKELREERDLTQQALADTFSIARSTYTNWEIGRREPDHAALVQLADFYGVTVDYILGRNKNEPTVDDDGLRSQAIDRVQELPHPALVRVLDFLDGLEAGQEIAAAAAAADDQDAESDQ